MNILLIYAYPNHNSLNHTIKEKVVQSLSKTHTLKEIDLYEESFDPVLRFDHEHLRRDLAQDPETAKYREMLEWADFLIFIYPIWWGGMPAILMIVNALGQTDQTTLTVVDYEQLKPMYEQIDAQAESEGAEHGIHMVTCGRMQAENLFIDPEETMSILAIRNHDVKESIRKTLQKCVADSAK